MKLTPLFDRVILAPEEAENTNKKGAIFISAANEQKSNIARVIEVGDGQNPDGSTDKVKMQVKSGDRVLYNKYAAIEFRADDKHLLIIKQTDIIAKLS